MRYRAALVITIIVALALSTTSGAIGHAPAIDIIPTPTPELTTRAYFPIVGRNWSNTMRMARFGDTYAGAYVFSEALMEDSWKSTRPPVAQAVSGANGAFDYYGDNNFPLSPVTATKKFAITSNASSAAIEDALITLRAATIATGRTKLWWLDRDNVTIYWSWAKCISIKDADTYKEKGRWAKKVELVFYMSEGVWYGETEQSETGILSIPATPVNSTSENITNDGNVDAVVRVVLEPTGTTIEEVGVQINTGGTPVCQWQFNDDVFPANDLDVNAGTYTCTNNAVGAYSDLDVGDATLIGDPDIDQVSWLWLPPGTHTFLVKASCNVGGGGEFVGYFVYWWDTYVF